jgi:hypothetical protein
MWSLFLTAWQLHFMEEMVAKKGSMQGLSAVFGVVFPIRWLV